ncbi:MAG: PfkB family carbohydrate kinase [Ktedonobacteraceae bacterium]
MPNVQNGVDDKKQSPTPFPLQFLTLGHVTRDLHPDGSFSLGGTVTFAALTAYRLGLAAGIITCASADLMQELPLALPDIALSVHPTAETTTFINQYNQGFRTQYLQARADTLETTGVPVSWQDAPLVLIGPLAQEIAPELVALFRRRSGAIIAATPQGWLRRWDADGRVWPTPWGAAEQILPLLDVLILSHDDLLPFANGNRQEADRILHTWSMRVPLLVATDGRHGATLFRHGVVQHFPSYTAQEVDPTGAGDVFAAAFLTALYKHGNAEQAVNFANCVASFSIEQVGVQGIPTLEMVEARMREALSHSSAGHVRWSRAFG